MGHFWLPDATQKRVPGVLTWTPTHGLELSLIVGFDDQIIEHLSPGVSELKGVSGIGPWPMASRRTKNRHRHPLDNSMDAQTDS